MEIEHFRDVLRAELNHVHTKIDSVIHLQKIANGRTTKLENKVENINEWKARQHGQEEAIAYKKEGVNWWLIFVVSILNIIGTMTAQAFWPG